MYDKSSKPFPTTIVPAKGKPRENRERDVRFFSVPIGADLGGFGLPFEFFCCFTFVCASGTPAASSGVP
jgi:hypothetical protein